FHLSGHGLQEHSHISRQWSAARSEPASRIAARGVEPPSPSSPGLHQLQVNRGPGFGGVGAPAVSPKASPRLSSQAHRGGYSRDLRSLLLQGSAYNQNNLKFILRRKRTC